MSDTVGRSSSPLFTELAAPSFVTCAQEQEVRDLLEFLKLEYRKNIQYKIILSIIEEYVQEDNTINSALKQKIKNIILGHRVSQMLLLDHNEHTSLLGIEKINNVSLNYLEGNTLQEVLKSKLKEQNINIQKQLSKTDKEHNNNCVEKSFNDILQLSGEEKVMLNTREKLKSEQELYVQNLLELQKVLLEISDLRLKTIPEGVERKIKHLQAQDKINSLKAVFTEEKFRVDIFTETNCSLEAYKELIKDIKQQQSIYQKEIQELEELKEKYKQVSCKQFDDILASYKQYKSSLEQKKRLFNYVAT